MISGGSGFVSTSVVCSLLAAGYAFDSGWSIGDEDVKLVCSNMLLASVPCWFSYNSPNSGLFLDMSCQFILFLLEMVKWEL